MPPLLDPTSNEQKHSKLNSGVIIGAITAETVRIWVRLYAEGRWSLVISPVPFKGDMVRLEEKSIKDFLKSHAIPPVYIGEYAFTQATNLTHTFDVTGLQPDTRYYYAVLSNETNAAKVSRRTEIGADTTQCFRTMPKNPKTLTFGFYSCHDPISANGDMGAWPHLYSQLKDSEAHFVIGGGDQIYVDTNSKNDFLDIWAWLEKNKSDLLEKFALPGGQYDLAGIELYLLNIYRWYYRVYWSMPAVRRVYETFPNYMIWDDHEIMDGWGSLTQHERLSRISRFFEHTDSPTNQLLVDCMWKAACKAYYEYEHSHNPETTTPLNNPDQCQWDYAFRHGSSAFYVLDMRGHHDVEKESKLDPYIILGKAQFERFTQWLLSKEVKEATSLFIVSPVPILHWMSSILNYLDFGSNKDDLMDEWGHKTHHWERNQLLEATFKQINTSGKIVVFLSGDVHCAAAFRLHHKNYPSAKVYQVTSSAISRKPAPKVSTIGIASNGTMEGNDLVYCEKLYSFAGSTNFAMIRVKAENNHPEITVDLYWPGNNSTDHTVPDNEEITRKRLIFS